VDETMSFFRLKCPMALFLAPASLGWHAVSERRCQWSRDGGEEQSTAGIQQPFL